MINVFNFGEMARRYRITYDHKQSAFTVHLPHKAVKFVNNGNDLYIFRPTMRTKTQYQFVHLAKEKTPKGFDVTMERGANLDDAAWIAGVSREISVKEDREISVKEDDESVKVKDKERADLVEKEKGVAMEAILGGTEPPTQSNEEEVNPSIVEGAKAKKAQQFAWTYSLKNGLKALGEQGSNAVKIAVEKLGKLKEGMNPKPTEVEELTKIGKNEATAIAQRPELQPVLFAGVTEGKDGGDIMSTDIPGKEVILNIRGVLVEDEKFVLKIEEAKLVVCPANDMIAIYVKEPKDGTMFYKFRKKRVNAEGDSQCEDSRSVLDDKSDLVLELR
jgi:hypothetical protein